jgi:phasin
MATKPARAAKGAAQNVEKVASRQANAAERATRNAARTAEQAAADQMDVAEKATRDAVDAARSFTDTALAGQRFEVPEVFRSFAEQGLTQTRETYGRMKAAAEEASDLMEESFQSTRENLREVQFRSLDVARANADATFDFARDLLAVNSLADAIQLQTAFARERFEAFVDYYKDVQSALTKASAEASKPAKALFDRTLHQADAV